MRDKAFKLGWLTLQPLTLQGATQWVIHQVHSRHPCVVVTSNIFHIALVESDLQFRNAVIRAELNVADGWPLVWASRLLGCPLPERVAGVDLVDEILHYEDLRVAILGGADGAASALAARIRPHADVVLVDPLPRGRWQHPAYLRDLKGSLKAAEPNLVLLGTSAPERELLAQDLVAIVSGPIICCGAAVDFLSGVQARAPGWMRRLGLEWSHRLAHEPMRLGPRYLRSAFVFLRVFLREAFSTWTHGRDTGDTRRI